MRIKSLDSIGVIGILLTIVLVSPVPFQIIALHNCPIMRPTTEASIPAENMNRVDLVCPHAALQSGNEAIIAALDFKIPISQ